MPDITLLEAAKFSEDTKERAISKIIVENSPILEELPMHTISGPAYRYNRERSLGTVAYRGVGGSYSPDAGVINPVFEGLVILGGEVKIDKFEVQQMSNMIDLKPMKYQMKARAMSIQFNQSFFEGDSAVNPYEFDGLRKRITSAQTITAGASGAVLTLSMLDQLMDLVPGGGTFFMNRNIRRQVTTLVRAQTGSGRIDYTQDAFGKQQVMYAGSAIRIVERMDDGSTILDFDETVGGSSITASVYYVNFGMDFVHGIQGMAMPSVQDFGEVQAGPYHLGRIEWYPGLVVKHPRSVARLKGVLTA